MGKNLTTNLLITVEGNKSGVTVAKNGSSAARAKSLS